MTMAEYKNTLDDLMGLARDDKLQTPDGMRAVANALFVTCRLSDEIGEPQWTQNMALLSGMACGTLMTAADKLEKGK